MLIIFKFLSYTFRDCSLFSGCLQNIPRRLEKKNYFSRDDVEEFSTEIMTYAEKSAPPHTDTHEVREFHCQYAAFE